jgi:hypothetical protein
MRMAAIAMAARKEVVVCLGIAISTATVGKRKEIALAAA